MGPDCLPVGHRTGRRTGLDSALSAHRQSHPWRGGLRRASFVRSHPRWRVRTRQAVAYAAMAQITVAGATTARLDRCVCYWRPPHSPAPIARATLMGTRSAYAVGAAGIGGVLGAVIGIPGWVLLLVGGLFVTCVAMILFVLRSLSLHHSALPEIHTGRAWLSWKRCDSGDRPAPTRSGRTSSDASLDRRSEQGTRRPQRPGRTRVSRRARAARRR